MVGLFLGLTFGIFLDHQVDQVERRTDEIKAKTVQEYSKDKKFKGLMCDQEEEKELNFKNDREEQQTSLDREIQAKHRILDLLEGCKARYRVQEEINKFRELLEGDRNKVELILK